MKNSSTTKLPETYVILESYEAEENDEIRLTMKKEKMAEEIMARVNAKIESEMNKKKENKLKAMEYLKSIKA